MDASDLIKALQTILQGGDRPHMGNVGLMKLGMTNARLSPLLWSKPMTPLGAQGDE